MSPIVRLLCGLLFVGSLGVGAEEKPLRLRVLSYNIHHGEGMDGRLDLERIARVILAVDPDLVALQEVDQNTTRTGQVDQVAKLAELTKLQAVFGSNLALQGGGYGNAVLAKRPIRRHENHKLPQLGPGEPRGALETEFELPDERGKLLLFATHFDHREAERERLESAEFLNGKLAANADLPVLLVGDLNAVPHSKTLTTLFKGWKSASDAPTPTIPVEKPAEQIDYILLAPAARWKVVEVKVLDEAVASDHRPLFAELEWQPAAKK